MAELKLHGFRLSPPTCAVMAYLKIHNIDFEFDNVDLVSGMHRTPDFLALNPYGTIPVLTHGDFSTGESAAIINYVSQTFDKYDHWWPSDPKEKALVNFSIHWYHNNFFMKALRYIVKSFHEPKVFDRPYNAELSEELRIEMEKSYQIIEDILATGKKVARTEQFSFADLLVFFICYELLLSDIDYTKYPHIKRWMESLMEIPEVKDCLDFFDMLIEATKS